MMDYVTDLASHYQGNHVMLPMGCDFAYANAKMNFDSMDALISYTNSHSKNFTFLYSTPATFVDALIAQNLTWPTKYDDMMLYADATNDYWSGYFSGRPNSKKQVRDGQANLLASSKLYALKALDQNATKDEISGVLAQKQNMLDAMGVYQHHDAVTGTARQFVADDYNFNLFTKMQNNNKVYSEALSNILKEKSGYQSTSWQWCSRTNGTYLDCPIANNSNQSFIVAVHNPSLLDTTYLKIKVSHGHYWAYQWSEEYSNLVRIPANVICFKRQVESGQFVNDCDMHLQGNFTHMDELLLYIEYEPTADQTVQTKNTGIYKIESAYEKISFIEERPEYGLVFHV